MVHTAGVVTRRTGVFPQLQQVKFDCLKCGYVLGPFFQNAEGEVKPNSCPQCQGKGPFTVSSSLLLCAASSSGAPSSPGAALPMASRAGPSHRCCRCVQTFCQARLRCV